ncbi:MAG: hypothetical protein GEV11_11995 [Streptosporangiales bacterium]|nr:hypothetical protein [Streptosporangiales bacterium]
MSADAMPARALVPVSVVSRRRCTRGDKGRLGPRAGRRGRSRSVNAVVAGAIHRRGTVASTWPGEITQEGERTRGRFPGRADQVSAARAFLREALASHPCRWEAELVVSELATNALRHTKSGEGDGWLLEICSTADWVIVTLTDAGSSDTPQARRPALDAVSGRGLVIIDELAAAWGYTRRHRQATVWVLLRREEVRPPAAVPA